MADTPPTLDYARRPRRRPLPWQAMVAMPFLILSPTTMCMCGHMGWESLPFTVCAVAFSWSAMARRDYSDVWRLLTLAVIVLSTVVFAKNAADILWFGHERLLRFGS